ncbi:MAG: MurR/RpiR family transcriptional regulator [Anaerolineae bacterium]|jgi:DNA-binding MurR/RpiR family transcriptional regulator|nr:MurR/RpiR family transcriptional regulator [Anaerolineae bacterium]MDX9832517.1 MurR/RpiR family transcriptional regulator [Anaerolineae bacterium]
MEQNLSDFQQRLENHLPELTKSQQRIASYLLASYDEAAFLPAADLAQRLDVSEATLVRFAKAIGYTGFRDLRRCLQGLFRAEATPASRLQHTLGDLARSEGHVLTNVLAMEVQYLTEASQTVDRADFDRAVDVLLGGRRIFAYASGPSDVLARLAELRFRRLGILTVGMTESGRHLLEKLQLLQPGDAVLVAGFHYARPELVAVLEHARATGCRSILLTDTLGITLRDKADVILAARRGPVSTFHSLTVPMAILNALILAVALARPEESLAALTRLDQLRAKSRLDTTI